MQDIDALEKRVAELEYRMGVSPRPMAAGDTLCNFKLSNSTGRCQNCDEQMDHENHQPV